MSVTMPRLMLMACLLIPASLWHSWALGLGEIHLNSALNEPMNAEIDLIAAAPEELAALRASLAPQGCLYALRHRSPAVPVDAHLQSRQEQGWPRCLVGAFDRRDPRALRDLSGRGELGPRPPDARIHRAARPAGVHARRARQQCRAGGGGTTAPTAPAPAPTPESTSPLPAPAAGATATRRPIRRPRLRAFGHAGRAATRAASAAASPPSERLDAGSSTPSSAESAPAAAEGTYRVAQGDTLTKIARSLHADHRGGDIDQTMIAMYRANPEAFGGNINILRRGAVLRVPGADEIAALNQTEAMSEVHRQMDAWRGSGAHCLQRSSASGHAGCRQRLPAERQRVALRARKRRRSRIASRIWKGSWRTSHRLIDLRNKN